MRVLIERAMYRFAIARYRVLINRRGKTSPESSPSGQRPAAVGHGAAPATRARRQQGQAAAAAGDGTRRVFREAWAQARPPAPSRPPPMLQGAEDGHAGVLALPANDGPAAGAFNLRSRAAFARSAARVCRATLPGRCSRFVSR